MSPLTWHSVFETVGGLVAIGTIGLALATTLLAAGTLWTASRTASLAGETKSLAESTEREVEAVAQQADAARQEVELTRAAMEATVRPQLIDVPYGLGPPREAGGDLRLAVLPFDHAMISVDRYEGRPSTITVPARNVGSGLALIQQVSLRWYEAGSVVLPEETTYLGLATPSVLPPGEIARANFLFGTDADARVEELVQLAAFAVEFDYSDAAGQQPVKTRIEVAFTEHRGWRVKQVHFFEKGQNVAYASSGASL